MIPNDADFLIKRFEQPDEVRTFTKGRFEIVKIGSMTIGRASRLFLLLLLIMILILG